MSLHDIISTSNNKYWMLSMVEMPIITSLTLRSVQFRGLEEGIWGPYKWLWTHSLPEMIRRGLVRWSQWSQIDLFWSFDNFILDILKLESNRALRCFSGGGHVNPLQYSSLENPMDKGTWWAIVHGVAESDMTEGLSMHTHIRLFKHWSYCIG